MLLRKLLYRLEQVLKRKLQKQANQTPPSHPTTTTTPPLLKIEWCSCQLTYPEKPGKKTAMMKAPVQMVISIKLVLRMGLVVSRDVTRCKCVQKPKLSHGKWARVKVKQVFNEYETASAFHPSWILKVDRTTVWLQPGVELVLVGGRGWNVFKDFPINEAWMT